MPAKWASRFTLCRAWTVSGIRLWLSLVSECSVFLEKWAWSDLYPMFFISALCCKALTSFLKKIASLFSFCQRLSVYQMGAPGVEPECGCLTSFRTKIGSSAAFCPPVCGVFIMNEAFGWGSHLFWVKCFQPHLESLSGIKILGRKISSLSFWHSLLYSLNVRKAIYRACTVITCLIFHQLH